MSFFDSYGSVARRWFFLAGGFICLVAAFGLVRAFQGKFAEIAAPAPDPTEFAPDVYSPAPIAESPFIMEETAPNWVVYITGAVKRPGVYEVAPGSRVNDALLKAGGFSSYADPDAVNLAAHLEDGVHIRVPAKNEQERVATYSTRPAGGTPSGARDSNAAVGKSPPASRTFVVSQRDDRIDINKAIAGELTELPGIGPKLAEAIVSHREENGPFEKIEDLQSVRGIGQKRFETLRNLIKVTK